MIEISPYILGFIAAYTILIAGSLSPGPSVAMLIGIATGQGRYPALAATLGIAFGSVTINIMTILGVGLVLSQAAWLMTGLRVIGALYLLYLAYCAFGKAIHPPKVQAVESSYCSPLSHFSAGYLLQVTTPKAIAFWLAISSVGAVEGAGIAVVSLFVLGGFLISFTCHAAWALALSVGYMQEAFTKWRRWIELTLGCCFTMAAYKVAMDDG